MQEIQDYPEVIDIANHYQILKRLGGAFTWQSIDEMEYLTYLYIIFCMNYEARAEKMEHDRMSFYSKEGM